VDNKDYIEVHFEEEDGAWAGIKMHIYDKVKEISLTLHPNDRLSCILATGRFFVGFLRN